MLELLFNTTGMWVDECLYVNKRLNSISSLYKAILKIWTKPLNSYGLFLESLYELFEYIKVVVV